MILTLSLIIVFIVGVKCGTYLQWWYVKQGRKEYMDWRKRMGFEEGR